LDNRAFTNAHIFTNISCAFAPIAEVGSHFCAHIFRERLERVPSVLTAVKELAVLGLVQVEKLRRPQHRRETKAKAASRKEKARGCRDRMTPAALTMAALRHCTRTRLRLPFRPPMGD